MSAVVTTRKEVEALPSSTTIICSKEVTSVSEVVTSDSFPQLLEMIQSRLDRFFVQRKRMRRDFSSPKKITGMFDDVYLPKPEICDKENSYPCLQPMETEEQQKISDSNKLSHSSYPQIQPSECPIPVLLNDSISASNIKRISCEAFVDANVREQNTSFVIVDCRYIYEYEGGHIEGAINVISKLGVRNLYDSLLQRCSENQVDPHNIAVVFHCEFSAARGPKAAAYFRDLDRQKNIYPQLTFPNICILDGGYKRFFAVAKRFCTPSQYISMWDESFVDQNKQCTKEYRRSWKQKRRSRSRVSHTSRVLHFR